jgi:N-acetylneuraminate lyase
MAEIGKSGATIFYGTDEMLIAGLSMGADGGIGSFYNVRTEQFARLYELARKGDWQKARTLQTEINEIIAIGLRYTVNPAVKAMFARPGTDCGQCLPPRRRLTPEEEADLDRRLDDSEVWQSPVSRK